MMRTIGDQQASAGKLQQGHVRAVGDGIVASLPEEAVSSDGAAAFWEDITPGQDTQQGGGFAGEEGEDKGEGEIESGGEDEGEFEERARSRVR
jgi:hypothetical protein